MHSPNRRERPRQSNGHYKVTHLQILNGLKQKSGKRGVHIHWHIHYWLQHGQNRQEYWTGAFNGRILCCAHQNELTVRLELTNATYINSRIHYSHCVTQVSIIKLRLQLDLWSRLRSQFIIIIVVVDVDVVVVIIITCRCDGSHGLPQDEPVIVFFQLILIDLCVTRSILRNNINHSRPEWDPT